MEGFIKLFRGEGANTSFRGGSTKKNGKSGCIINFFLVQ